MRWLSILVFHLKSLFCRRKLDAQMAEEMRIHLEMATEAKVATGMTREEARDATLREFGNTASVQEQTRDERVGRFGVMGEQWRKDLLFTIRSLCRARGFSLTVLTTLVLGIGVVTVAFDSTEWILFRAQPYPRSDRLLIIGFSDAQNPFVPYCTAVHFQAFREQTTVFSEYAAAGVEIANTVRDGVPGIANVNSLSIDALRTLGIQPILGRSFVPEENRSGANHVVIISDLFWREQFHSDEEVIGRKILINQETCTIVGVMKPAQAFPSGFGGDIYRPLVPVADPSKPFEGGLTVIGRLADGVSVQEATAALAGIKLTGLPSWAEAYFGGQKLVLNRLTYSERPETPWVVFIAAVFLYAIACLNTVNLLLVRLLGRRRELSIRLAVGGSRWRIVRLLLLESAALCVVASLIVILAARYVFPSLFALLTNDAGLRYYDFWDWYTLSCIIGLSSLACVIVALVPAWRLGKVDLNAALKEGGAALGESRGTARLRNIFVALQAAFAVILLAGTGLLVKSFERLHHADLGFRANGLVKVLTAFPKGYDLAPEARLQFFDRLRDKLAAVPGVRGVTYGQDSLLVGGFWGTAQLLMPDGADQPVVGSFVDTNFPQVVGLTVRKGRWFSGKRGEIEAVINETMARALFGDDDPIGRSFKIKVSGNLPYVVVGVFRDVKYAVRSGAGMCYFVPIWMYPPNATTLVLRLDGNPKTDFEARVRRAIYDFDPRFIATSVASLDEWVDPAKSPERFAYRMLKILTPIAVGLTMVGLFSVITFAVKARKREFGVRLALGASPGNLQRLVFARSLTTAFLGLALGVGGALVLTRYMQSLLFETAPYEPVVYVAVCGLLLIAAALACWLPAHRVAKVDPVIALRSE